MESSASARRVTSAALDPRRWRALTLLCGTLLMVLTGGTITKVALPSTGAGLRFSEQGTRSANRRRSPWGGPAEAGSREGQLV